MKKLISLLLAVTMIIGISVMTAAPVFAEDPPEQAEVIPPATNLAWDGTKATWDRVIPSIESKYDYFYYSLELFKVAGDGTETSVGVFSPYTGKEYELATQITKNGYGKYFFTIKTYNWSSNYSEPAKSDVQEFTEENTPQVPLQTPKHDGWRVNSSGMMIAYWVVNTDNIASDASFSVTLNLYKNGELYREIDGLSRYSTYYYFNTTDEIPLDSEDVYSFGVKLVPEDDPRYTESKEARRDTDTVCPATLLPRRLYDFSVETCRAGDDMIVFVGAWSGAYGSYKRMNIEFKVTSADEDKTVTERGGGIGFDLNYVHGSNHRFLFNSEHLQYTFKEGDFVEWKLYIVGFEDDEDACVSGSLTIEASTPHTVTLDALGYGENTTVTVPDRSYLSSVENVRSYYPVTPGYTIIGLSKVKKAIDEYTSADSFSGKISEDTTLYTMLMPSIDTVEINVEAPVCGTVVEYKKVLNDFWYDHVMSNTPEISVPENDLYKLGETYYNTWQHYVTPEPAEDADPDAEPHKPRLEYFTGTIKGGEQYYTDAELVLITDENGMASAAFAPVERLKATGNFTESEPTYVYSYYTYGYADFLLTVTAVHDWGEWTQTLAPTETAPGEEQRVCAGCGEVEKREIEATGHTLEKTEAKAATCTADGNKEYYTCTVCKKLFSDDKGTKEITLADTVDKTEGHKLTKTAARAATCAADGNKEYYTCSVCKKLFSDDKGTKEITLADTVTKATGHKYGAWTILDNDYHKRVCANDATHIEKEGHTWDEGKVTKEASYDEEGEKTYTCSVCKSTKTEKIPKPEFIPGDVDGNGSVEAADARFALRAAVGLDDTKEGLDFSKKTNRCFLAADVTKDGNILAEDARSILRAAVGLESLS